MTDKVFKHHCWSPDDGDESSAVVIETMSGNAAIAAEFYVERMWSSFDNALDVNVHVRNDYTTELTKWVVTVEMLPSFLAKKVQ